MTIAAVAALVRNITQHRRLPFTFLRVAALADAWQIDVRDGAGAVVTMTVAGGDPIAIRAAILSGFDEAIEDAATGSPAGEAEDPPDNVP